MSRHRVADGIIKTGIYLTPIKRTFSKWAFKIGVLCISRGTETWGVVVGSGVNGLKYTPTYRRFFGSVTFSLSPFFFRWENSRDRPRDL